MMTKRRFTLFLLLFALLMPMLAIAQDEATTPAQIAQEAAQLGDTQVKNPSVITKITVLAGIALLPFAIILLTSFLKMVIVLSLVRQALGVQQSPPNQALNGIALLMTIYVMFPTALEMYQAGKKAVDSPPPEILFSGASSVYLLEIADAGKEPFRKFLLNNTNDKHEVGFLQLAKQSFPEQYRAGLKKTDFIVLIPAYITSQLKGAFEIAVLIYLPFFVIDLVTSNILLAMGMVMLSPLTIALPLKLLLIVMVDGWTLVIKGLVQTFR